jgi:acyl dehydratase
MNAGPWSVAALEAAVGSEIGLSKWMPIPQARIDAFAEITEDRQFIHTDPEAAAQTRFGGTVAHGFLTLSMLSALAYDALPDIDGATASVNYGFERVRFITPLRSGSEIRAHFTLSECFRRSDGALMIRLGVTMEIAGTERPALTAEWIILFYF